MASARLLEALNGAWQIAEARSRRYERGSFSPLPVTPEDWARVTAIEEVERYAETHTDRETAAAFPEIVQRAVTPGTWERIKP